jgi:hypothetical protein
MGPPDTADPALCVVTNGAGYAFNGLEFGDEVAGGRGKVSNDNALKHEERRIEYSTGAAGWWVEV